MTTSSTSTMMEDLTDRMQSISYNDQNGSPATATTTAATTTTTSSSNHNNNTLLYTPQTTDVRPWDGWIEAGPPADPIPFDPPIIHRGRRVTVVCYIPATGGHERLPQVLLSDEPPTSSSRRGGRPANSSSSAEEVAYYPIPHKKPIKTIMGHVEICAVLKRCRNDEDTSLEEDDDEDEAIVLTHLHGGGAAADDDEDVVFELTDEFVAVKVNYDAKMRKLRGRHAEDPLKEIAAMQLIGNEHPHVLGCRDVLYDAGTQTLNVVLRYCPHGDLFQMLQDFQGNNSSDNDDGSPGLTEPQARYWFRQILLGLKHLRDLGICHRDLSPENVMMDHQQCLVIDFGMCLRVPYSSSANDNKNNNNNNKTTDIRHGHGKRLFRPQGACGKLPYMSPEIYKNRQPFDGELADVWTAGTILFCMLSGNRSYGRPHSSDPQFYWMTHGLAQMLKDWGVPVTPEGLHLLQNMLQINPRLRLTLDECLAHPWFNGPVEEMDLSDPMLGL
eukprot:CAMPEP_0168742230 /NCGR_PEP_ID=MMETSP0724-20121128/12927_1 /TAXON_ID=265536 /ORGANISM="Amphiprora sp., Strain CCMP467" /LENGTH=498 /DNA_ID=CAMNT_0008789769 /DNA_START=173 /DNA_END=1669 /DNA_ORIENTATION=+